MESLEMTVGILIAIIMIGVAAFFIWRQQLTRRTLHGDSKVPVAQRRYLLKQCSRRFFGSFLLILLAGMMIGSLFFDYQLLHTPLNDLPLEEQEAAKQTFRFISIYWMSVLMLLMAVMALAVFDLLATARHGVQQQKRLLQEHQELLEAELEEHRHRQAEMN